MALGRPESVLGVPGREWKGEDTELIELERERVLVSARTVLIRWTWKVSGKDGGKVGEGTSIMIPRTATR